MNNLEKYTELQLKHQQQLEENRTREKERKARTHRLIVRGAIAEGLIADAEIMSNEEFQEELDKRVKGYAAIERYLEQQLQ